MRQVDPSFESSLFEVESTKFALIQTDLSLSRVVVIPHSLYVAVRRDAAYLNASDAARVVLGHLPQ